MESCIQSAAPNSGLTQNPGVSGAVNWAVGYYNGAPGPDNEWGPDAIGWDLQDLDNIVQNGPQNGVTFPCTATIQDRKSTRLNSSHVSISYAVFCLKKKKNKE